LVVVARFKGCEAEPGHDSRGARGLREGDEDAKIEGQTRRSLPQLDGGVQQPQN
jgi:hypothetical protein